MVADLLHIGGNTIFIKPLKGRLRRHSTNLGSITRNYMLNITDSF